MSTTQVTHEADPAQPAADTPAALAARLSAALGQVIQGHPDVIETVVTTVLARGHLLLEDVPGVGKTTLAGALGRAISANVRRIQFTSDMLPTDVTGLSVFDQESGQFVFHPGPIFANIIIGDEVNRATPKTQSALLEAMEEQAVTVDGRTHRLPQVFIVAATQNPQDMAGTFALPEAQRDRFMTRISLGYPDAASELRIAIDQSRGRAEPASAPVATVAEVHAAQLAIGDVHLSEPVGAYLVDIIAATRTHSAIALGASPRATVHLSRMSRARAAVHGRDYVSPDDVAQLSSAVLAHRLIPRGRFARADEAAEASADIMSEIISSTPVR